MTFIKLVQKDYAFIMGVNKITFVHVLWNHVTSWE